MISVGPDCITLEDSNERLVTVVEMSSVGPILLV